MIEQLSVFTSEVTRVAREVGTRASLARPRSKLCREPLAASHDLLVKSRWQGIEISDLIRVQLAHFKDLIGNRIKLNGPSLRLSVAAAQTLGRSSMSCRQTLRNMARFPTTWVMSTSAGMRTKVKTTRYSRLAGPSAAARPLVRRAIVASAQLS